MAVLLEKYKALVNRYKSVRSKLVPLQHDVHHAGNLVHASC